MTTVAHEPEADAAKPHRRWFKTRITLGIIIAIVLIVAIVGAITPWPSAMVIRAVFTQGGDAAAAEMERHVPDAQLTETLDISYGDDGADTTMDVFTPASATKALPTIVWIHGGAWISGSKETSTRTCASSPQRGIDDRAELHAGPGGHLPDRGEPDQ